MLTERFDRFLKTDEAKLKEADEIMALLKNSPEVEQRRRDHDEKRLARIRELLPQCEQVRKAKRPCRG
jgi:hypothetical protein